MRIFLDTEFIEQGYRQPMYLISLALVREDGQEYYAELEGIDWDLANDWVIANVLPYLTGEAKSVEQVKNEVLEFCGNDPEFWAYFADYDWVLFCQLFGRMIDLRTDLGWPMFCLDLKQFMYHVGVTGSELKEAVPQPIDQHWALADARWNSDAYNWLSNRFVGV